jgi:hypothetical protein
MKTAHYGAQKDLFGRHFSGLMLAAQNEDRSGAENL